MENELSQMLSEAPVAPEDHYAILKFAEVQIKEKLQELGQEWLLVGLRVGYYIPPPDDDEDLGQEYKLEYGYLDNLDNAQEVESEEEWQRILDEGQTENPLPIEDVYELYSKVKEKLERAGGQELLASVFGVLKGNSYICFGSGCYCQRGTRIRSCYYDPYIGACVCYCTDYSCD